MSERRRHAKNRSDPVLTGSTSKSPPRPRSSSWLARSWNDGALGRLVVAGLCFGLAYALGSMGRGILITGVYDYALETSGGPGALESSVKHEDVHATGDWAREQGLGFVATAAMLSVWGAIILWGMAGPLAIRAEWAPAHTLLAVVSLACCATAVVAFFPPWRIGRSMSCNAFYLVVAAFLYLATVNDRDKVRARSQKIFPALISSAVLIGPFSSGYGVGIIAGIFIGILLAAHVLLLIPRMRAELWTPGEAGSGTK